VLLKDRDGEEPLDVERRAGEKDLLPEEKDLDLEDDGAGLEKDFRLPDDRVAGTPETDDREELGRKLGRAPEE